MPVKTQPLVLVVDDDCGRRDAFRNMIANDCILFFAENPMEAIRAIRTKPFDYIFLDFDLSDMEMNGGDVACSFYGSRNAATPVWIHSWNIIGAAHAREMLLHVPHRPPAITKVDPFVEQNDDDRGWWLDVLTWIRGQDVME